MPSRRELIAESVAAIRGKTDFQPEIGIILGTGLGKLGGEIDARATIPYAAIPGFLVPTVESHAGRLILGTLSGKRVCAMQGRFHYYEGYDLADIAYPVRVMKELGCRTLVVSNACGGVNPQFRAGDIAVITDHINLIGDNPLRGRHEPNDGPRFPDMYDCYAAKLRDLAIQTALDLKLPLQRGVYLALAGPNLETAAEYRMCRTLGADMVGMSTVPEVIVAKQTGLKVLGFSVITDMGLPDAMAATSLEDVLAVALEAEKTLTTLIKEVVRRM
jgi:purine-nucleoside phosphorylase